MNHRIFNFFTWHITTWCVLFWHLDAYFIFIGVRIAGVHCRSLNFRLLSCSWCKCFYMVALWLQYIFHILYCTWLSCWLTVYCTLSLASKLVCQVILYVMSHKCNQHFVLSITYLIYKKYEQHIKGVLCIFCDKFEMAF